MPKYVVLVHQYVEEIAEIEVVANTPEAAALAVDLSEADWHEGSDTLDIPAFRGPYAVMLNGNVVWEEGDEP